MPQAKHKSKTSPAPVAAAAAAGPPAPAVPPGGLVTTIENLNALKKNLERIESAVADAAKADETRVNEILKALVKPDSDLIQIRGLMEARSADLRRKEQLELLATDIEKKLPELNKLFKDSLKTSLQADIEKLKASLTRLEAELAALDQP
jgi:hypothetical protein